MMYPFKMEAVLWTLISIESWSYSHYHIETRTTLPSGPFSHTADSNLWVLEMRCAVSERIVEVMHEKLLMRTNGPGCGGVSV